MWYRLGQFVLKFRLPLLISLIVLTGIMGWYASKVQISYEFGKAIPTDNPRYLDYLSFKEKFGDDGNAIVLGIDATNLFTVNQFNAYASLHQNLKKVNGVQDILSIPQAVNLIADSSTGRLVPVKIFAAPYIQQAALDSAKDNFFNLPFYDKRLYSLADTAALMAVMVDKDIINSKNRTQLVNNILAQVALFEKATSIEVKKSGLPFIRTIVGDRIKNEMNLFLAGSLILSAITLLLFFRSISATVMSLLVVGMGVVFSLGTMVLLGFKITLLNALIPPLVVVIGIPNCIYFLNKFHATWRETGNKNEALITMVGRMGVVTLFCNIAAAIGFAVFGLTNSALLKEFGVVAGINIMALFFIRS
jgi:uncharacterized protein